MILEKLNKNKNIHDLTLEECNILCDELRNIIIETCSKQGGHLASSLGLVELTVAVQKCFDTSVDRVIFDVGHQCYAHKILTGRLQQFAKLRDFDCISGFPKPEESLHDAFAVGHASNSVSIALGMAKARTLQGKDYHIVTIIGDGALTGGLAYEGLLNAGSAGEPLIIIVNDNRVSIGKNLASLNNALSLIRSSKGYLEFKGKVKNRLCEHKNFSFVYNVSHHIKSEIKNILIPVSQIADAIGFRYLGPVNGHDVAALERILNEAKKSVKPVIVHITTTKGKGYFRAENNPEVYHGVSSFDRTKGIDATNIKVDFSYAFGQELCRLADKDKQIFAVTAAMISGTGLKNYFELYPNRCIDCGIAEEHAISMCAGLAKQGMKPVFAVYSTFLQRAFDELVEDVSLNRQHVILAIDRAGIVGRDGETHQGIFDIAYLSIIPDTTIYMPSCYAEMKSMLSQAIYNDSYLSAIRYPRGCEGIFKEDTSANSFIVYGENKNTAIVSYGIMINQVFGALESLKDSNEKPSVIKINRWNSKTKSEISNVLSHYKQIIFVEDVADMNCIGHQIMADMSIKRLITEKVKYMNTGSHFVKHGNPDTLLHYLHLDAESIMEALHEQ